MQPKAVRYILKVMGFFLFFFVHVAMQQTFPVSVVSEDLRIYRYVAIDELGINTSPTFSQNGGIVFTC